MKMNALFFGLNHFQQVFAFMLTGLLLLIHVPSSRAVWHQADPITKGTRWALVIFYKVEEEAC